MNTATAIAHPNIAFIKYWGNIDEKLRLPANGSISMNLDGLYSRTRVQFDESLGGDVLILNDQPAGAAALQRVSAMLDRVRRMAGLRLFARVESNNNFPTGTGIASSASAFAALALAASHAAGLDLDEPTLSRLARTGSGSASRSIPGGFVEWQAGQADLSSYAFSIAPPEHWRLVDCVTILSQEHKATGSREGHTLAPTSPLQSARVLDAPRRLEICRRAVLERDFEALAHIMEQDSNMMHAVMMTSKPILMYWHPLTIEVMRSVTAWRKAGLPVGYTIDAGPNVHVICQQEALEQVSLKLRQIPGVIEVIHALPGPPARLIVPSDALG